MRHLRFAVVTMASAIAAAHAQQVATVVVEPETTIPGPTLTARNDTPPLALRGTQAASTLTLSLTLRDAQSCLRSLSVMPPSGQALAGEPVKRNWWPSVSVGMFGSSGSSSAAPPTQQQQQQPPQAPPASTSNNKAAIGVALSVGGALFDMLRERCEQSLQARFVLPAGVDARNVLVQAHVAPRADAAALQRWDFALRESGGAWVGAAPASAP